MAHPASVVDLPTRLGKLTLREVLSSSFFGARHRARDTNTARSGAHALGTASRPSQAPSGEPRAVRVVQADASDVLERLALAATAVRAATHPALLAPLQIVRDRGRLGVATRDEAGLTLAALEEHAAARKEGLPQAIALRIALDVLEGLSALEAALSTEESRACLYGGLTPDSIHVGFDGQTRLIDPGVMAAAAREGVWADEPRMLAYSAPELYAPVARHVRHDARTDTFAIGVVLWELLSCRTLFGAPSAHETIEAVCHLRIARVRRERFVRGEPIMATVANVVARALEREPARRFQSYDDLGVALREAAPAATTAEVAAFVTAFEGPLVPLVIEEPPLLEEEAERVTARVARPAREETTLEVPVVLDAAAPMIEAAPKRRAASRRHAAWALGAFALVALAAWALFDTRATHEAKAPPAPRTTPAVVVAPSAVEPPSAPAAEPSPALHPPADVKPPERVPQQAQPAPRPRAAKPASSPRKPAVRRQAQPKRPFIPSDI